MRKVDENGHATFLRREAAQRPPSSWRTWLLGHPLSTADAQHQTIRKRIGLAVFAFFHCLCYAGNFGHLGVRLNQAEVMAGLIEEGMSLGDMQINGSAFMCPINSANSALVLRGQGMK